MRTDFSRDFQGRHAPLEKRRPNIPGAALSVGRDAAVCLGSPLGEPPGKMKTRDNPGLTSAGPSRVGAWKIITQAPSGPAWVIIFSRPRPTGSRRGRRPREWQRDLAQGLGVQNPAIDAEGVNPQHCAGYQALSPEDYPHQTPPRARLLGEGSVQTTRVKSGCSAAEIGR